MNFRVMLAALLAGFSVAAYAGLADDVNAAFENEQEFRPQVDAYLQSDDFDTAYMLSEILKMSVNGAVVIVYWVEYDAQYAYKAVRAYIQDHLDLLISATVIAASGKSPAMCPIVKALAKTSQPATIEAVVAVSTETPEQTSEAIECVRQVNADLAGLVAQAVQDVPKEGDESPQSGGGNVTPPVSPN